MISLTKPFLGVNEIAEVENVFESGQVSQGGPKTIEFEKAFSERLGISHAIVVTNCTAALHLSLLALGIKEGDEVLVPSFTFPATAHAIVHAGARPVFVDVDSRTYNIDWESASRAITLKTKAVIPVHLFGLAADMNVMHEFTMTTNIAIIEDAACALGAKWNGKYAGTIGRIGCFSFHGRKVITTGEGGMVVTNSGLLADEIRSLANFGKIGDIFLKVGYNYKMSDIAAAIGIAQLKRLNWIIGKRRFLAKYWDKKLKEIGGIESPSSVSEAFHVYQSYVALLDKTINRDALIKELRNKEIEAQIGTYACHILPAYKELNSSCPVSFDLYKRSISLPLYPTMSTSDIDYIVEVLKALL